MMFNILSNIVYMRTGKEHNTVLFDVPPYIVYYEGCEYNTMFNVLPHIVYMSTEKTSQ